ncbi:MAG: xanthine dehydrogenase family protein molybdopterin-binding subunit [Bryobacteraceae bacterium]|nr:xanthine dehydrogenase family protein molybdopterin-binding subunit [Bryobacteraceae bacterium]MDW8378829.1 xanthine dehydrogenase family protein molybdopterin-binding subunit [Bryobacterales bacterium]
MMREQNVRMVSRRGFLETMFSAGAMVLGVQILPEEAQGAVSWQPSVYLGFEPSGTVVIVAHRSEMGTGIRTALPMVLADELEADWKQVRIEQAIGDAKYGSQNTDGSCSIRDFYVAMRDAGASARLMLERAAAAKWNVPASECKAQSHQVVHAKSGQKAGFGELVALAAKQSVPAKSELVYKTPAEFRYVGKDVPVVDLDGLVTGSAVFGYDAKAPGMLYASIERSPVFGGQLKSYDDSETKKVKGVVATATIDPFKPPHGFQALGGVAVLAENSWAAMQGRKKLKVNWEPGPNASWESGALKQALLEAARKPQKVVRNVGNVEAEFARAAKTFEAEYYVPMLAHAAMEPPAAVAEFKNGKVTAWAPTQNPQAVQDAVSAALGIPKSDVICHVTLLGGGFGRKSKPDYVVEAALLSKQVGRPVKVIWSREEDIKFDYFHTVSAMYFKAATDAKGRPTAWLHRSVFPTIGSTFVAGATDAQDFELGMGLVDLPFDIPNHRAENGGVKNPVRIGWMRAVANIYHAFGIHSFVDELAHAAGRDRVEYLLDVIGSPRKIDLAAQGVKYWNNGQPLEKYPVDTGRLRRVIELAAEKSGWANKKSGQGRGWGIAAHRSFLTYVCAVVEVEVDAAGRVRIPRVDVAVDAGTIVHPDRVRAQFEGAAVFGASLALMGEITGAKGEVQQSNFHNYPVARIHEAPRMTHVHVVPSSELPAGVGEPGVPPIAPAIANAIFAATGKRIRELPVKRHKLA